MKNTKKNFLLAFLLLIYLPLNANDFNIFFRFSIAPSEDLFFSREIAIEKYFQCEKNPFNYMFSFTQESFDNIFWGVTNRLSLKYNLLFGNRNNLFLKAGSGIGFSTSYGTSSFSTDIYLKLYYWLFFILTDTSFYTDGLFNKNGVGIEFKIWEIIFDIGLNNIIVSDYEYSEFKLRYELGAGYEF